jgi:hypothetical protein
MVKKAVTGTKPVTSQKLRTSRDLLRHTVATLAYRAEKVLRDVPPGFAAFRVSEQCRTPLEILSHLGDLMEWAERLAQGEYRWEARPAGEWDAEAARFFKGLKALDRALAAARAAAYPPDTIFQGPVADALTHVGQLSMLRGIFGAAVRPEAYARATIRVGRVGRTQPAKRVEFDGDASRPRPKRT